MKILILNNQLVEQVIEQFPREYLTRKSLIPLIIYEYQIENYNLEIRCFYEVKENTLRGINADIIYCTHEDYNQYTKYIGPLILSNKNLEVRLIQLRK